MMDRYKIVYVFMALVTIAGCGVSNEKSNNFEFPALTGSYGVGLTERYVKDVHRKEPHNPDAQRELMVSIWYPAQSNKNARVAYWREGIGEVKASLKRKGYPETELDRLDKVYCHAMPNADIAQNGKPYPVIIFSHGYIGCEPHMYIAFCEELASHGYIVAAIAHTYYATEVKFPDGRIIKPAPEKYAQQSLPTKQEEDLWVADIQFVADSLHNFNNDAQDAFHNMLDMKKIGIVGHSMGGSAAYAVCVKDSRFKVGISLDSLPFESGIISALNKPFLIILAQETIDNMYASDQEFAARMQVDIADVQKMRAINATMLAAEKNNYEDIASSKSVSCKIIPDIRHMGFSDLLLLKELPLYKNHKDIIDMDAGLGATDGSKTVPLINEYMVTFLKANLFAE